MYIRNRIPSKDDPFLVEMVVSNFNVRTSTVQTILGHANEVLVVCDSKDHIIGFVSYRFRLGDMIYVDYVVLDAKHQGKGIASSFLPVFEKHMIKQGIRTIYGTVDEDNPEALSLFKRWGFQTKGQIGSSIIIEKHLHSSSSRSANNILPTITKASPANHVRRLTTPPSLGGNK
ncbi:GNAT family N-acetyltransferase [Fictibacillus nanhaiensis]|uniref:GNAT family N-acetyltransferase n=1 Tax=Fictibacillus nanhaiensis TaxID=742169 RepID=UPI001C96896E|nr:GNAT family N-acetyltransferase [Fictibacillus nanhaiensis]MBY6037521.1 GNAT family N-acetyltransferase [Fictibacillus nanhaiensis]